MKIGHYNKEARERALDKLRVDGVLPTEPIPDCIRATFWRLAYAEGPKKFIRRPHDIHNYQRSWANENDLVTKHFFGRIKYPEMNSELFAKKPE